MSATCGPSASLRPMTLPVLGSPLGAGEPPHTRRQHGLLPSRNRGRPQTHRAAGVAIQLRSSLNSSRSYPALQKLVGRNHPAAYTQRCHWRSGSPDVLRAAGAAGALRDSTTSTTPCYPCRSSKRIGRPGVHRATRISGSGRACHSRSQTRIHSAIPGAGLRPLP